jgi:hypothetical protein
MCFAAIRKSNWKFVFSGYDLFNEVIT